MAIGLRWVCPAHPVSPVYSRISWPVHTFNNLRAQTRTIRLHERAKCNDLVADPDERSSSPILHDPHPSSTDELASSLSASQTAAMTTVLPAHICHSNVLVYNVVQDVLRLGERGEIRCE